MSHKNQFNFILTSSLLLIANIEASLDMAEGFCEILKTHADITINCASKAAQDEGTLLNSNINGINLSKAIKMKHNLTTELSMIEIDSTASYLLNCYLFQEKIEDLCAMENLRGFRDTHDDLLSEAKIILEAAKKVQSHQPMVAIRYMFFYVKCSDPEATDFQLEQLELNQVAKDSYMAVENNGKVLTSLRSLIKKYRF